MADHDHPRPALRFTRLDLRRFLGLRRSGQTVHLGVGELSPGVTLIAGPNGSGKTTTARAIEAVLWPEASGDPQADVTATLECAGQTWTAELAGQSRRWLRAGVPVPGPSTCAPADRDRYRLSLHELLTADDHALAAGIRRELGGGYSLADAAQRLEFSAAPGVPRKGTQRLRQAVDAVAVASREQADLRRREADLAGLRAQEAEALTAAEQLQVVTCLIAWRDAGRLAVAARRQVAQYEPRCALLRGKEYEQWRDVQRRQAQAEVACTRAASALETAAAALARRHAERPLPSAEVLIRCRTLNGQLQQAESEARVAAVHAEGVQAREAAARQTLAARLTPEQLARLDRLQPEAGLAEAVRAAAEAAIAAGALERFRGLPCFGESAAAAATQETWRRGLGLLRAWLQEGAPPAAPAAPEVRLRPLFALAAVGAGLSVVLALWLHGGLLLPAAVLAVLAWCLRPRPPVVVASSRRPDLEAEFGQLGLALPSVWSADAVARALEDLALRCSWEAARGRLLGEGAAVRAVLEKDATDRAQALAACQAHVASHLGCDLDGTPLAVFHLVTRLAAWQEAREALAEAQRRATAATEAVAALLARLATELAGCGALAPADGAAAAAVLDELERERTQGEIDLRERDRLAQELAAEQRSRADLADRRRDLLQAVGLRPDEEEHAEDLLRQWTALRPALAAATEAARSALTAVERCRDEARRLAPRRTDVQALRSPQLLRQRDELERAAARREQLLRDIESTETLVREAKRRHDLELRLAERDEAMAELVRERDAGWCAIAGQACAELVASRLELRASGVLSQAQQLFATITRGRYRLLADELSGDAVFRARDTETDHVHDLASLSSGTRVQLLLAARLAFIAEKEGDGPMLPLLLDEVLGNSDDDRAGTIVDTVIAATRHGRQVFCLTAQADEVGKWQSRLQQAGIPFSVCWLPQGAATAPALDLAPVAAPAIAAPQAGETPVDYARRLGVPALDRFDTEAGGLHLWYLIDDPQVLQALLTAGYRTWGALALLLSQEGAATALQPLLGGRPALAPQRLAARAEMVMLLLALVRIGHGRALSRASLIASGAVSERYADEVAGLLDLVHGDACELVRRLEAGEVRGFRRRSLDDLSQWLREHGHIDPRPRLSAAEVQARLHAGGAAHLASGALTLDDLRALLRLADTLAVPEAAALAVLAEATAVVPTAEAHP